MSRPDQVPEVRGSRDLAALWRALPVGVWRYPASALPSGLGLAALSDSLRARAWREHCASPTPVSCAEQGGTCAQAERGSCHADVLFPLKIGGGTPSWRMATLAIQWRPALGEMRLIAFGEISCRWLRWAASCLYERHRLGGGEPLEVATLGDLELTGAERFRVEFVTPWVVRKGARVQVVAPDAVDVAQEWRKAMRTRAHKITALCVHNETWQRLGGHLVHHVADALLPAGLTIEEVGVEAEVLNLGSRGNGAVFQALTWRGAAMLRVDESTLPWLSLVATCGGGENTDKGFGGVEVTPLN